MPYNQLHTERNFTKQKKEVDIHKEQKLSRKLISCGIASVMTFAMIPSYALATEDTNEQETPSLTNAQLIDESTTEKDIEQDTITPETSITTSSESVDQAADDTSRDIDAEQTPERETSAASLDKEESGIIPQAGTMNSPVITQLQSTNTGYVYNDGQFSNATKKDVYAIDIKEAGTYIIRGQNAVYVEGYGYNGGPCFEVYDQYQVSITRVVTSYNNTKPTYEAFHVPAPGRIYIEVSGGSLSKSLDYAFTVVKQGWYTNNGNRFYNKEDGTCATGWQNIGGKRYYFSNKNGAAAKGLVVIDGKRYYFGTSSSAMATGWQTIGGKRYYFSTKTGAAAKGLVTINGATYYFGPSSNAMATGWQKIGGKRYYFSTKNGKSASGLVSIGGYRYYFGAKSHAAETGWQKTGGYWD